MATNFVEQATLKLNSRDAERAIRRMNALLARFNREGQALRRTLGAIDTRRLRTTAADLEHVGRQLRALRAIRPVKVQVTGVKEAQAQLTRLERQLRHLERPVRPQVRVPGNAAAPAGGNRTPAAIAAGDGLGLPRTIAAVWAVGALADLTRAVRRGLVQGYTTQDVAETRYAELQRTPEQREQDRKALQWVADEQNKGGGSILNKNQTLGLYAENLGVTAGNAEAAGWLTDALITMIEEQVRKGKNTDEALEEAISFAKAGEMSLSLVNAAGDWSKEAVDAFADRMRMIAPAIGKEFTGPFWLQMTKYARGNKRLLNDDYEAFILASMGEEQGSSAAVGYNQAAMKFRGFRLTKQALAEFERIGLVDKTEHDALVVKLDGGQIATIGEAFAEINREDTEISAGLFRYMKFVKEKVKAAGYDLNSESGQMAFAGLLGDRTAVDVASGYYAREKELMAQYETAAARDNSRQKSDEITQQSGLVALQAATNAATGALGKAATKLEAPLIWGADKVKKGADSFTESLDQGGIGHGVAQARPLIDTPIMTGGAFDYADNAYILTPQDIGAAFDPTLHRLDSWSIDMGNLIDTSIRNGWGAAASETEASMRAAATEAANILADGVMRGARGAVFYVPPPGSSSPDTGAMTVGD